MLGTISGFQEVGGRTQETGTRRGEAVLSEFREVAMDFVSEPQQIRNYLDEQAENGRIKGHMWESVRRELFGIGGVEFATSVLQEGEGPSAKELAARIQADAREMIADLNPDLYERLYSNEGELLESSALDDGLTANFGDEKDEQNESEGDGSCGPGLEETEEALDGTDGRNEAPGLTQTPDGLQEEDLENSHRPVTPGEIAEIQVLNPSRARANRGLNELESTLSADFRQLSLAASKYGARHVKASALSGILDLREKVAAMGAELKHQEGETNPDSIGAYVRYNKGRLAELRRSHEALAITLPVVIREGRRGSLRERQQRIRAKLLAARNRVNWLGESVRRNSQDLAGVVELVNEVLKGKGSAVENIFQIGPFLNERVESLMDRVLTLGPIDPLALNEAEDVIKDVEGQHEHFESIIDDLLTKLEAKWGEKLEDRDKTIRHMEKTALLIGDVSTELLCGMLSSVPGGVFLAAGFDMLRESSSQLILDGKISNPGRIFIKGMSRLASGAINRALGPQAGSIDPKNFGRKWKEGAVDFLRQNFPAQSVDAVKDGYIFNPIEELMSQPNAAEILEDPDKLGALLMKKVLERGHPKELLKILSGAVGGATKYTSS